MSYSVLKLSTTAATNFSCVTAPLNCCKFRTGDRTEATPFVCMVSCARAAGESASGRSGGTHLVRAQEVAERVEPRRDEHRAVVVRAVVHDLVRRARDVSAARG